MILINFRYTRYILSYKTFPVHKNKTNSKRKIPTLTDEHRSCVLYKIKKPICKYIYDNRNFLSDRIVFSK